MNNYTSEAVFILIIHCKHDPTILLYPAGHNATKGIAQSRVIECKDAFH